MLDGDIVDYLVISTLCERRIYCCKWTHALFCKTSGECYGMSLGYAYIKHSLRHGFCIIFIDVPDDMAAVMPTIRLSSRASSRASHRIRPAILGKGPDAEPSLSFPGNCVKQAGHTIRRIFLGWAISLPFTCEDAEYADRPSLLCHLRTLTTRSISCPSNGPGNI